MKRAALLSALNIAKSSLGAADGILPILSHFCFMEDLLYAYNDVTAIIVPENTGLACALHGDTLLGILDASLDEDVRLQQGDHVVRLITSGGGAQVPSLATEAFIFDLPDEPTDFSLAMFADMKAALSLCLGSIATDTLKPEYTGVTVYVKGGVATFYSTNNATASRYVCAEKIVSRKTLSCVLPEQAVTQLLKLQEGSAQPASMAFGAQYVQAGFVRGEDQVTFISKLLPAVPERFEQIFAQHENGADYFPIPKGLDLLMRKAQILIGKGAKEALIEAGNKGLSVKVFGQAGNLNESVVADYSGLPVSIWVNPELVAKALPNVDRMVIISDTCALFQKGSYTHIVAAISQPTKPKAAAAPSKERSRVPPTESGGSAVSDLDDDIPF